MAGLAISIGLAVNPSILMTSFGILLNLFEKTKIVVFMNFKKTACSSNWQTYFASLSIHGF
jgi:hypothetical protein